MTDTSLITSKAVLRHEVVSSREDNSTWSKLNYPFLVFLNVRCRNRFRNFLQSYFKVFHSCWHVHFISWKISYFFWCQAFNTPPHSHQWCISSQEGKKIKSLLNTGWWVQLFERFNTASELSCCIQKDSIKNWEFMGRPPSAYTNYNTTLSVFFKRGIILTRYLNSYNSWARQKR